MEPILQPGPFVSRLVPYLVPLDSPRIDLALGVTERPVPSADLRASDFALDAESLARYPDGRSLEAVLAARLGTSPDQVMVTAGADEALDRAFRAMLTPNDNLVVATPTFEMVAHYANLIGAEVVAVPWEPGGLPTDAMLAAVTPTTKVVVVVSPNNPTGAVATATDIRRLSSGAPHALVLLDMAYGEFADVDLTADALACPNVIVVRSLSKAWGLPGVRIGYVAGPARVLGWLRAAGGAYSVARPSMALVHARLGVGGPDTLVYVERVRSERQRLEALLRRLGAVPWPSQANFVLARFNDAAWVTRALAGLGIGIRTLAHAPELGAARRITCPGDAEAFARLEAALRAALRPEALLFDLHGTLAHPHTGALLCAPALLARLAARVPLGAVTSWGRREAGAFLKRAGVAKYFSAVVTREEAAAKPDPAPVLLALARLSVQSAWFIGDAPNDIRAARAASRGPRGVVPLGLAMDTQDDLTERFARQRLLERAGAAQVLDDLACLEILWP